ncbi:MAG: ABC transporter ATP-binding protein/permease [Clostridia bacterium]|nr:ABC transporter ATP-binding protein/permease [Clostridia bacterium]
MLETKNLKKTYKPKRGVPVTALDDVSLVFPEKGMVFLLGKSGSGKSTLRNMLGGLDKYDSGEIIIKGVSSKTFNQQSFDSYRNTYVGFIFQEYNVLAEFTVGANIALALELQGKKATDEEINKILGEVDLAGFGSRRPNELSGGQLQRVAIARALVKNPEIIMADEPTGALDSNTGRQVLETLKKLSREKLVIVVSHDRDFAEKYADRIIELSDGRVIRDVECLGENLDLGTKLIYDDGVVGIPAGYHLTEEDRLAINEYMDAVQKGLSVSVFSGNRKFTPTDSGKIKKDDGSRFKLIKSRLPLRSAFKIGGSGLKYKKFRLIMTILLSTVAFTLFALADTCSSYKHIRACVDSLVDSNVTYATIKKSVLENNGTREYWVYYGYLLDQEDLTTFYENTGIYTEGVYNPEKSLTFTGHFDRTVELTDSGFDIFASSFSGFTEISSGDIEKMGYELIEGRFPDGTKNEIAISKFVCETFIRAGYTELRPAETSEGYITPVYQKIASCGDMVGKTINLEGVEYTVTGIIDTDFDLERYSGLIDGEEEEESENIAASDIIDYVLYTEFTYDYNYSLCRVAFVGDGFIDAYIDNLADASVMNCGYIWFSGETVTSATMGEELGFDFSPSYVAKLKDVDPQHIVWLEGERTELGEKEIVIPSNGYSVWGKLDGDTIAENNVNDTELLKEVGELHAYGYSDKLEEDIDQSGWKIVGYVDWEAHPQYTGIVFLGDDVFDLLHEYRGLYSHAVGAMPESRSEIMDLVEYSYDESRGVKYTLQNPVIYELDIVDQVLEVVAKVFLYIGIGFALFAALLLANFIATSISYKKQEIGILRAIGSRSADVFRIFFSESFIIAMINFSLSLVISGVTTAVVNMVLRSQTGILITILHFGIRQAGLLLLVCIGVAFIGSFLPVRRIASMRPIDAIRNR